MFNVVENGAPRWSSIPIQSFHEGGSASLGLTDYLSDTNNNGQVVPVSGVTVEILSVSDENLVEASIFGQTINVNSLDDDSNGLVEISLRASDGDKSSDTTVTFHVLNVNDAPIIDTSGIEDVTLKLGAPIEIDLISRITDIDDPDEEIWITATSYYPGAVYYDPLTGIMSADWPEEGSDSIKITAEDRHGASSTVSLTYTIVDDIPLDWEENFEVEIDSFDIGSTPTVVISNIGDEQLSDIRVTWTVCNKITGICHSAGSSFSLGPFVILPVTGSGLSTGDYFTLSVQGVDENGFDRRTPEQMKYDAVSPQEDDQSQPSGEQPSADEGSSDAMFLAGASLVALISLVAIIIGINSVFRRGPRGNSILHQEPQTVTDRSSSTSLPPMPVKSSSPPPPPPMIAPLPPGGLPPGWTMEQWHYYGEEYLEKFYGGVNFRDR